MDMNDIQGHFARMVALHLNASRIALSIITQGGKSEKAEKLSEMFTHMCVEQKATHAEIALALMVTLHTHMYHTTVTDHDLQAAAYREFLNLISQSKEKQQKQTQDEGSKEANDFLDQLLATLKDSGDPDVH